jgi:3-isopropylmalate dehydrogenase
MFDEAAQRHPEVKADRLYVDACSAMLVKRPWDFDVMVMENMFGDILSDMTAGLIGGMGMAPSADIGDRHAVFQPCHGTAPDIMGQGKANPTGMILSTAMMLDWLADKHGLEAAAEAGERIERAVDKVYADGIKPMEFGGRNGTADIAKAVLAALYNTVVIPGRCESIEPGISTLAEPVIGRAFARPVHPPEPVIGRRVAPTRRVMTRVGTTAP